MTSTTHQALATVPKVEGHGATLNGFFMEGKG